MIDFPRIVIEVEQGIITAVYFEGIESLCAVVDIDQQRVGEEAVSFIYTQPGEDVPEKMRQEINRLLRAEHD